MNVYRNRNTSTAARQTERKSYGNHLTL